MMRMQLMKVTNIFIKGVSSSTKNDVSSNVIAQLLANNDDTIWKGTNKDDSSNFNLKFANLQKKSKLNKVQKPLEIQINNVETPCFPKSGNPTPSSKNMIISPHFKQPYNKYNGSFHELINQGVARTITKSPRGNNVYSTEYDEEVEENDLTVNRINSINTKNNNLLTLNNTSNHLNPFLNAKGALKTSLNLQFIQNKEDENDTEEYYIKLIFRFAVENKGNYSGRMHTVINENGNLSTRFSTNDSNDSFDSNTTNKCNKFFNQFSLLDTIIQIVGFIIILCTKSTSIRSLFSLLIIL